MGQSAWGPESDPTGPALRAERAPFIQLLTPEGERRSHADFSYDGDVESIGELYRQMVRVRRVDTEGFALQRHGELGLWPPALGQEAVLAGAAAALTSHDYAYPTYREQLLGWLLGVDVADLLAVWRCSSHGGWDSERLRFGPMSIVIGSHPLHATGHALGMRLRGKTDGAVIAFFGDGASSQGDVMEALELAALQQLPVVFFCQNNHYAISVPVNRQSSVPIVQRAEGFGMPGIQVDGNDALACQAVIAASLQRAREGGGPILIEAMTYRMGPHTTSDDPTRYRDDAEVEAWRLRDPIDRVRKLLEAEGMAPSFFSDIDDEAESLGESVRAACLAVPEPDLAAWFDRVYVEQTNELRAQKAEYEAWRSQYGGVA